MAFSQAGISGVRTSRRTARSCSSPGTSPAPQGTVFQVYVDRRLAWSGTSHAAATSPIPAGAVGAERLGRRRDGRPGRGDAATSRRACASLGDGGQSGPALAGSGGTYLDPTGRDDVQGFRIYRSAPSPGGPVDCSAPVDDVAGLPGRLGQRRVRPRRLRPRRLRPRGDRLRLAERPARVGVLAVRGRPLRPRPATPSGPGQTVERDDRRGAPPPAPAADGAPADLHLFRAGHPAARPSTGCPALPSNTGDASGNDLHGERPAPEAGHGRPELGRPVNANADFLDGVAAIGGLARHPDRDPERDAQRPRHGRATTSRPTARSAPSPGCLVRPAGLVDDLPLADRRRGPRRRPRVPGDGPRPAGPGRHRAGDGPPGRRRARPVRDRAGPGSGSS